MGEEEEEAGQGQGGRGEGRDSFIDRANKHLVSSEKIPRFLI